jgi:hypothetical protein
MIRRNVFFAAAVLLILLQGASPTSTVSVTVGPNVNVTKVSGNQTEGTIAVNPTNTQQLFAAFNGSPAFKRSTDGGATWVSAGAGVAASCCDEVAAWDSFGNLFLVNINAALNAIPLYISTDGGANFTLLATMDAGSVDQPTVKTGANSVWVTWNKGGIKARGAAVTGLGAVGAFGAIQAAPGTFGQFGDIAIGPSGQVFVVYQSSNVPCPCTIYGNLDADGLGAGGFGAQIVVSSTNVDVFDFIPAQDGRSIDAEANLAWDRSGGPNNGRLYMVYTDEIPDESNNTDIYVRYSDTNGTTWSAAVKANDDATSTSQFLSNISIDQTSGNLAVTWHDARGDTGANNLTRFWAGAVSNNGGISFTPNFQISTGQSNDDTAGSGVDYGDYSSSDFHGGHLHVIWADNSNSTGDNPAGANSTFDMYTVDVTVTANAPSITNQPQSQTISYNTAANLTITASGTGLGFQWYHGLSGDTSHPYAGATSSAFTPTLICNTNIWCRVANSGGSVNSSTALVTVNFTGTPVAQATAVQALHLVQVRDRLAVERTYLGLGAASYTNTIVAGGIIKAIDITQTQTAIAQGWAAAAMGAPVFSTTPAIGSTIVLPDLVDLRTRLQQLESFK